MFDYTIAKNTSNEEYIKTCELIEKSLGIKKSMSATDVDGSLVQTYNIANKVIKIFNDYTVGAVYVKADIEVPFLHSWWEEKIV